MADWDVVSTSATSGDPWAVVSHEPHEAPKDGDPVPESGVPKGFYAVTGDDGKQTLRHETGIADVGRWLSDLPGVGAAERAVQGGVRLAGKAASGVAGLFGADPKAIQQQVNTATELPPSNDPLVRGPQLAAEGVSKLVRPVDEYVENLPPGPRSAVEGVEEAVPDVAAVLGLRVPGTGVSAAGEGLSAARSLGKTPAEQAAGLGANTPGPIARLPEEVSRVAGYTGLRTRADLHAPGNQAITDTLISSDAGIIPGQRPSIAALENARRVGPGKVYARTEQALPQQLVQDDPLRSELGNLPQQVSQLPRSPDVDALQEVMLSQPQMTRDELFANIREARERAKSHWKSDDPDKAALGDAYAHLASSYEDFAGRQLEASGAGVSLPEWQAARVQMAKNYQAQGALRGEHFDAGVYGKLAERNPHLLTGNSAIVGHVANGLPSGGVVGMADIAPAAGGALAGEAIGQHMGVPGVGAVAGAITAPMVRARLEQLLTRGRPDLAAQTSTNPALSYFFDQGRMPAGWNRAPSSPLPSPFGGYLPSPGMVNAGGGASTANTLRDLGLTPDVQAAGAAHPAAARLVALREQLSRPPMEPVEFQGPQNWGPPGIETKPPSGETKPSSGDTIPFEKVLEQGGTQARPVGGIQRGYRPAPESPKGPNMRTPPGAPALAAGLPPGPSPAQVAFKNKQTADRLRKLAGDLRLEGAGMSTGDPLDRVRAALERRQRGFASGGTVNPPSSTVSSPASRLAAYIAAEEGVPVQETGYAGGGEVGIAERLAQFIAKLGERLKPAASAAEPAAAAMTPLPDAEHMALMSRFGGTPGAQNQLSLAEMNKLIGSLAALRSKDPLPGAPVSPPTPQFADGGSTDESTTPSLTTLANYARDDPTDPNAENRARVATNLASLFYGLDAQGNPAFGGRAWTPSQGGTPMGALDALTATPHNLIQFAELLDKHLPGQSNPAFWESIDPQWSADAARRLAQLRQRVQQQAGLKDDGSLTTAALDAVTDPAMIAPLGAARAAEEGSLARRALNWMTGGTPPTAQPTQGAP